MSGEMNSRIKWLSDLIRLEIVLWDRIDGRLKAEHDLPLSFFETLYFISRARQQSMRVGELAEALGITVGGASKVVDRIEEAGLIARIADSDRRASRIVLTAVGKDVFERASKTYETELGALLDATFSPQSQQEIHRLVLQLLTAANPNRLD